MHLTSTSGVAEVEEHVVHVEGTLGAARVEAGRGHGEREVRAARGATVSAKWRNTLGAMTDDQLA